MTGRLPSWRFRIHSPVASGVISVLMPQRVLLTHRADGVAEVDSPLVASKWRARFSERGHALQGQARGDSPACELYPGRDSHLAGSARPSKCPGNAQAQTRLSARRKTIFVCEFGKLGNHFTVRVRQPFRCRTGFPRPLVNK